MNKFKVLQNSAYFNLVNLMIAVIEIKNILPSKNKIK